MEQEPTVKVVFRKFKDNKQIIALFPEEKWLRSSNPYVSLCLCYMHIGQHGPAEYKFVIKHSVPAKTEEYAELKKELEQRGYILDVRKRN